MTVPNGAPPVGAQFRKTDARPWTDTDGTKHTHTIVTECRITARDAVGCDYVVTRVVSNTDAPPEGVAYNPPTGGQFAWFGLAAAMERGRVVPL